MNGNIRSFAWVRVAFVVLSAILACGEDGLAETGQQPVEGGTRRPASASEDGAGEATNAGTRLDGAMRAPAAPNGDVASSDAVSACIDASLSRARFDEQISAECVRCLCQADPETVSACTGRCWRLRGCIDERCSHLCAGDECSPGLVSCAQDRCAEYTGNGEGGLVSAVGNGPYRMCNTLCPPGNRASGADAGS